MKIIDLTSVVLKSYEYPNGGWVLVRIQTEAGVEGIGECFVPDPHGGSARAAKELIDHSLRPVVLGKDVLDTQLIWEQMYEVCRGLYDRRGLAIHSISGVDQAVFDAAGKTLGVPVHKLLGGCFRDRVRVYVSSIWIDSQQPGAALEDTAAYVEQGYTAIKYWGWPDFGADLKRDARLFLNGR